MNNVTPLNKNSADNLVGDFQKQNIKFDIDKLRNACNDCLLYTSDAADEP